MIKTTPKLTIGAAYSPPQVKRNPSDLDAIVLWQGPELYIIDFNAKHTVCNNTKKKKKKTKMTTFKNHSDCELHNYQIIRSSTYP